MMALLRCWLCLTNLIEGSLLLRLNCGHLCLDIWCSVTAASGPGAPDMATAGMHIKSSCRYEALQLRSWRTKVDAKQRKPDPRIYIYIYLLTFIRRGLCPIKRSGPQSVSWGPRRNRARRTSRRGAFLAGLRQQAHDLQEVVTEISPRGSQEGWRRCSICPSFFEVLNQIESETLQPYQVIVH